MKVHRFTAVASPRRRSFSLALATVLCVPLASCGGGGGGGSNAEDVKPLYNVILEPSPAAAAIGATASLLLTAIYEDRTTADVRSRASWTSSDPAIATVVAGTVTGVSLGSAIITADYRGRRRTLRVDIGVAWRAAGQLLAKNSGAEAVALRDGRALVLTGVEMEVFDPAAGRSVSAGAWSHPRADFSATLLADGRVLVAGGYYVNANVNVVEASALLFDPAALAWSDAASMSIARRGHKAVLLQDGRVLVVGWSGAAGTTAEIYDPAADTWSPAAGLAKPRSSHTATLLQDGRVMVFGGFDGGTGSTSSSFFPTNRVELFDPRTGTWTVGTPPHGARFSHSANLLADGRVLVTGGRGDADLPESFIGSAELYDPVADAWAATGSLIAPRYAHHAVLLPGGRVMVASGTTDRHEPVPAEVFDPARGSWSAKPMLRPRNDFPIVALPDGTVLAFGGDLHVPNVTLLEDSVESYR